MRAVVQDRYGPPAFRPVIDRVYPMDQVAEAHARVETWHKVGNVVLTL